MKSIIIIIIVLLPMNVVISSVKWASLLCLRWSVLLCWVGHHSCFNVTFIRLNCTFLLCYSGNNCSVPVTLTAVFERCFLGGMMC